MKFEIQDTYNISNTLKNISNVNDNIGEKTCKLSHIWKNFYYATKITIIFVIQLLWLLK